VQLSAILSVAPFECLTGATADGIIRRNRDGNPEIAGGFPAEEPRKALDASGLAVEDDPASVSSLNSSFRGIARMLDGH
jgi:hypothetical protein